MLVQGKGAGVRTTRPSEPWSTKPTKRLDSTEHVSTSRVPTSPATRERSRRTGARRWSPSKSEPGKMTTRPRTWSTRHWRPSRASALQPGVPDRGVRRRERQQAAQQVVRGRLPQGRGHLAADHPDHPPARVRCGGRRARAAAAGRDRGRGGDRPDRSAEPDRPVDESVTSVVLLVGLAVGVDYSMFYLRREREERARGNETRRRSRPRRPPPAAPSWSPGSRSRSRWPACTSPAPRRSRRSPPGRSSVVAIAVIGSLTVLPAVLSKLGDRVNKGRMPFLTGPRSAWPASPASGRRSSTGCCAGRWSRRSRPPRCSLVLAIPVLNMQAGRPRVRDAAAGPRRDRRPTTACRRPSPAARSRPRSWSSAATPRTSSSTIARAQPAQAGGARATWSSSRSRSSSAPTATSRWSTCRSPATGQTTPRCRARRAARRDHSRDLGQQPGVEAGVTGYTAGSKDFNDLMESHASAVFAFVLAAGVPAAAGHLPLDRDPDQGDPAQPALGRRGLRGAWSGVPGRPLRVAARLRVDRRGRAWLPLFLFVILFGLSMDYHVFILSRIREAYDRGASTTDAVSHGIKTHGRRWSPAAAAVMVAVFAIFATLSRGRVQADRRRPGRRGADRRDDRPRRPAAGDDEAARRLELVPAALARLAAQDRDRRAGRFPYRTYPNSLRYVRAACAGVSLSMSTRALSFCITSSEFLLDGLHDLGQVRPRLLGRLLTGDRARCRPAEGPCRP